MILEIYLAMVQNTENLQAVIRSWMDFGWELMSHPLISFLLGVVGGAHVDGKVRRLWGKGINKVKPKPKNQ